MRAHTHTHTHTHLHGFSSSVYYDGKFTLQLFDGLSWNLVKICTWMRWSVMFPLTILRPWSRSTWKVTFGLVDDTSSMDYICMRSSIMYCIHNLAIKVRIKFQGQMSHCGEIYNVHKCIWSCVLSMDLWILVAVAF